MVERARGNEVGHPPAVLVNAISPNSRHRSPKERVRQSCSTTRCSIVAAGTSRLAFNDVRLQAFGVWPGAPRPRDWSSGHIDLVDDETLLVPAVTIGVGIERRRKRRGGACRCLLEFPKQPGPFVMMSRLRDAAGGVRKRAKILSKILAQSTRVRAEETRGENTKDFGGMGQIMRGSGRLEQRNEGLE